VRLIGDSTDQEQFHVDGPTRIRRIMSGCTGHLLVLPERRPPHRTPEQAYKYFLIEWQIGQELCVASRMFCVARSALPDALAKDAIEVGQAADPARFEPELVQLHDEIDARAPYCFLATDFKHNADRNDAARDVVEHVLGMKCWLGSDYPSEQLREAIVEKVRGANLVLADLASAVDPATKRLRPNVNTCVEAGIALGSGRPVFVTALDPASVQTDVVDRTAQLPFMFRNNQVQWYASPVEYLAKVHRIAMSMRRRILNDEIIAAPAARV
jgi:hypothetical protein